MVDISMALAILGGLSAVVNIIVEVIKGLIPKSVPTQLVTLIISFLVCLAAVLIFCEISLKFIAIGFFMSPIVAFTSMNGFDSLTNILKRFQIGNKEDDE